MFADGCAQLAVSFLWVVASGVWSIIEDATHDDFWNGGGTLLGIVLIVLAVGIGGPVLRIVRGVGQGSRNAVVGFTIVQGCLALITLVCVVYAVHPAYPVIFPIFLVSTVLSFLLLRATPRSSPVPPGLAADEGHRIRPSA